MFKTDKIRDEFHKMGVRNISTIFYNLPTPTLVEKAIIRGEGMLSHLGPLVVRTGQHTGRSPNDKFIVKEPSTQNDIWWGESNQPLSEEHFDRIFDKMKAYIQGKDLYVQDCYAGTDPDFSLPIRVINESAWHNMFARNIFVQIKYDLEIPHVHNPEFTLINMPNFYADPAVDGTNSEVFIIVNYKKKLVLIGGTSYAGEMKKGIFSVLNYLLPKEKILSMHCSANVGKSGDVALFFGLSGTGKTALSCDPKRFVIGDDEHGWSEKGIFNFEGGCYAKVLKVSRNIEPDIYETTRMFGTILENVMIDSATRRVDLDDSSLTENTRAAFPLTHLRNHYKGDVAPHPKNIILLTADAFGILPPIAKLTPEQAIYHFLSGYTAKIPGTEQGVREPAATFSTCYGAPFITLHPTVYAKLFGENIRKHNVQCWLVNTGWSGGQYGEGKRIEMQYTRAMLHAALEGQLDNVESQTDAYFGIQVPTSCPGVPNELLDPKKTWNDKDSFDDKARELVSMFHKNFRQFESSVEPEIVRAGPVQT